MTFEQALLGAYLVALGGIAVIDIRTMRAPNRIVFPAIGTFLVLSLALPGGDTTVAVTGMLAAFALLLVIAMFGRGSMGYGDVKYGAICGGAVGIGGVIPMLGFTFLAGGAIALAVLASGRRSRHDVVAFTPFLFAGVIFSALWSPSYLMS